MINKYNRFKGLYIWIIIISKSEIMTDTPKPHVSLAVCGHVDAGVCGCLQKVAAY